MKREHYGDGDGDDSNNNDDITSLLLSSSSLSGIHKYIQLVPEHSVRIFKPCIMTMILQVFSSIMYFLRGAQDCPSINIIIIIIIINMCG
jgi:hypothetical protein